MNMYKENRSKPQRGQQVALYGKKVTLCLCKSATLIGQKCRFVDALTMYGARNVAHAMPVSCPVAIGRCVAPDVR